MAELPEGVQRLMALAREANSPTLADRARVARALSDAIPGLAAGTAVQHSSVASDEGGHDSAAEGEASPVGGPGTAATGAAGAAAGVKLGTLLLTGVLAGTLALLAFSAMRDGSDAPQQGSRPAAVTSPQSPPAAPKTAAERPLPEATDAARLTTASPEPARESAATAEPAAPPPPRQSEQRRAARRTRGANDAREGAMHGSRRDAAEPVRRSGAQAAAGAAETTRRESSERRAASSGTPESKPSGASELELMRHATRALSRGEIDAVLALLDEHAQRFSHGVLRPEREALRALALCKAGRHAEGRPARARFLSSYPNSLLADRVRGACRVAADGAP